jgi:DNA-binding protein HU-beta
MNRSELVAAVAAETGHTQAAVNGVLDAMFTVVTGELKKGTKVTIPGWVAFERTYRAARTGRNPQTGATIQIAATNSVKVSAGSKLKASVK